MAGTEHKRKQYCPYIHYIIFLQIFSHKSLNCFYYVYCFPDIGALLWRRVTIAIIVHYTIQFNLEYCKNYVPDMGPNTILKIKKNIIKRRPKNEINIISNIQSL